MEEPRELYKIYFHIKLIVIDILIKCGQIVCGEMNASTNIFVSKRNSHAIKELISKLILSYNHHDDAKLVDDFIYDM